MYNRAEVDALSADTKSDPSFRTPTSGPGLRSLCLQALRDALYNGWDVLLDMPLKRRSGVVSHAHMSPFTR